MKSKTRMSKRPQVQSFGFRHSDLFRISLFGFIDLFLEGPAHHIEWRWLAAPYLQCLCALVEQHTDSIGSAATCTPGLLQQKCFCRAIDHIIDCSRTRQCESRLIKRQRISKFQADGRRIQKQVNGSGWIIES